MAHFVIHGGFPLRGEVQISGSKNAALPILAATLLTGEKCVVRNVPDIEDIHTMIEILESFGSGIVFKNHTVAIQTRGIKQGNMSHDLACKMRASVVLLGPLLARTGYAHLAYPGGCVLGARPIDTHVSVLRQFGISQMPSGEDEIIFKGVPKAKEIVMPEFSVTATENAVMIAAGSVKPTTIRLAALEPHAQDLCRFLQKMGVEISGIGSHTLTIQKKRRLRGVEYSITPDYLEAGTFVLAGILTRGNITVKNIVPRDLDAFWNLLREMKIPFELGENAVKIKSARDFGSCRRLQTNVFPGFPTDLQPPFAVLMTQAKGKSRLHETLFEGRFAYFSDLARMGAHIEKLNPHEAIISGPTALKGTEVKSWDIRAGAAMILAGLIAKGKTVVTDIQYIDRGYEKFDGKLRKLGARIERR